MPVLGERNTSATPRRTARKVTPAIYTDNAIHIQNEDDDFVVVSRRMPSVVKRKPSKSPESASTVSASDLVDCVVRIDNMSIRSPVKAVRKPASNHNEMEVDENSESPKKRARRHTLRKSEEKEENQPQRRATRQTPAQSKKAPSINRKVAPLTAVKVARNQAPVNKQAQSERITRTRACRTADQPLPPPDFDNTGFEREGSEVSRRTTRSTRSRDTDDDYEVIEKEAAESPSSSSNNEDDDDDSSSSRSASSTRSGSTTAPRTRRRHSAHNNKTPSRTNKNAARRAVTSARKPPTPAVRTVAGRRRLQIQTETPSRKTAVKVKTPAKVGTNAPGSLLCREEQHEQIRSFVLDSLVAECSRSLYVSGVPGTGKTATVHQVIEELVKDKRVPTFQFIEVNGMRLTDPNQVFVEIYRHVRANLDGLGDPNRVGRVAVEAARRYLNSVFDSVSSTRLPVVLLVDELDLLCTRRQHVLYELFDWATRDSAKLVILAVANTLDLPERLLTQRVNSRMGMARLQFQPYQVREINEILNATFVSQCGISVEPKAIEFVARKVAAVSGDLRKALEICRRARDMVAHESHAKITLHTMQEAIRALSTSSRNRAILSCSEHQHLLLRATAHLTQRTGVAEVKLGQVIREYWTLCKLEGYIDLNLDNISCLIGGLDACGLMLCSGQNAGTQTKCVSLKIPPEELLFALADQDKK